MFIVLPNKIDGLAALESKLPDTFMNQVDRTMVTAKWVS